MGLLNSVNYFPQRVLLIVLEYYPNWLITYPPLEITFSDPKCLGTNGDMALTSNDWTLLYEL